MNIFPRHTEHVHAGDADMWLGCFSFACFNLRPCSCAVRAHPRANVHAAGRQMHDKTAGAPVFRGMKVKCEFSGGIENLFNGTTLDLELPSDVKDVARLIEHLRCRYLCEREELFILNGTM